MQTKAVIRAALKTLKAHPDWKMVPEIMIPLIGDIKELKYVKKVVVETADAEIKAAGSDMSKVVKTTVFIKDMNDFAAINAIYAQYFAEPYPARSCVEVARLPKDVLVECELIAEL